MHKKDEASVSELEGLINTLSQSDPDFNSWWYASIKLVEILCAHLEKIEENVKWLLTKNLSDEQLNDIFMFAARSGELAFMRSLYAYAKIEPKKIIQLNWLLVMVI